VTDRDPDGTGVTLVGPLNPEPTVGDGVMFALVASVVVHCSEVVWPSSIRAGLALKVAVGTGTTETVMARVIVSGPEHPARVALRV